MGEVVWGEYADNFEMDFGLLGELGSLGSFDFEVLLGKFEVLGKDFVDLMENLTL